MRAVVKFFNDLRGYGFVTAEDLEEDLHHSAFSMIVVCSLMQGQKLLVKVDGSGRGPQVQAVRSLQE